MDRFRQEASSAAGIAHPNNVTIFDVGVLEDGEQPFIVMERLDGYDLEEVLTRAGPMAPARLLPLFATALEAIRKARRRADPATPSAPSAQPAKGAASASRPWWLGGAAAAVSLAILGIIAGVVVWSQMGPADADGPGGTRSVPTSEASAAPESVRYRARKAGGQPEGDARSEDGVAAAPSAASDPAPPSEPAAAEADDSPEIGATPENAEGAADPVSAPAQIAVEVESKPTGAMVYVAGRKLGRAPQTVSFAGAHAASVQVVLKRAFYETATVNLGPGDAPRFVQTLKRRKSSRTPKRGRDVPWRVAR